jgi:hypothetical protein
MRISQVFVLDAAEAYRVFEKLFDADDFTKNLQE